MTRATTSTGATVRSVVMAGLAAVCLAGGTSAPATAQTTTAADAAKARLTWGAKIPMRDGVLLNATVYTPRDDATPRPCIFTLTPYVGDNYTERGMYFAAHGLPFLTVDVRGRGNSEGTFTPFAQEINDGHDVVEWLAKQPYCNGKVAMWGGSYAGFDQWAAAKTRPPHLATIVPAAAASPGTDFPWVNNLGAQYPMQWLTYTAGHAAQPNLFGSAFWPALWRERFEKGMAFTSLEHALGGDQPILREWIKHHEPDAYYDAMIPTDAEMKAIDIPILTITASYDDDQPGALTHYKRFMALASPEQKARHFLIIGPWDHAGTRTPQDHVGGVKFGPASLVDLPKLHVEWYNWTMAGGARPAFLTAPVAYYVTGADTWRHADSLEAVTGQVKAMPLASAVNADSTLQSGLLGAAVPAGAPDHYVYDPKDTSRAALEESVDVGDPADQTLVLAEDGKHLVYATAPFAAATEVSGFFKLSAFIAIDQPDTDFRASVYEITSAGNSILLTSEEMRARYRTDLRKATLITTRQPLEYVFHRFPFTSRKVAAGSRLRLVISPINSIYAEKNYNSGKPVPEETLADARAVTVTLFHDKAHPSTLYVPLGRPE